MKKQLKYFLFLSFSLLFVFLLCCTHDDEPEVIIPPSSFEYGIDKIKVTDGYNFDHAHSSVRWETAYLGTAALLTGRFNDFEFFVDFDQEDLTNSSFTGKVTLSSVNTGEPGRDAGCLLGTFGTDVSDEATFASTTIEEDGEGGYLITGNLTFHNVTSDITGTIEYLGTTLFEEGSGVSGAPLNVAGFVVRVEINAKSVFGIESGSIADRVLITASGQFKQPI